MRAVGAFLFKGFDEGPCHGVAEMVGIGITDVSFEIGFMASIVEAVVVTTADL